MGNPNNTSSITLFTQVECLGYFCDSQTKLGILGPDPHGGLLDPILQGSDAPSSTLGSILCGAGQPMALKSMESRAIGSPSCFLEIIHHKHKTGTGGPAKGAAGTELLHSLIWGASPLSCEGLS